MDGNKTYWLDRHRFLAIAVFLLIIWAGIMVLLYLKADEVTKDPCSICAKKIGTAITCTNGLDTKIFYPNLTTDFVQRQQFSGNFIGG